MILNVISLCTHSRVSVWLFIICTVFCLLVFRLLASYCLQSFGKYRRDKLSTLNFLFIFSTDVETWRIFPVRCNHRQKCEVERKESDSYLRHPTNLTCKCSIKEISFFIESSPLTITFSWKSWFFCHNLLHWQHWFTDYLIHILVIKKLKI